MKKVPEIRFAEYVDDWEQRKVGDVLSESRDAGHSGDIAKKLTVKLWGKGVYAKDDKGSAATQYFTRHAGQFIYSKLDFLNSAFGVVPQELESYESTADLPAFDCVGVEPYFMFYRAIQPSFYLTNGMIADGSRKAKRIHVETFLDMPLDLPSIEEQQKVASYFIQLDTLITLHQRKLEKLMQFKSSMLEKMFPQNGESVPEIRFAGFTGAWEQRKLSDLIIEYKETVDSECDLPVLTSSKTEGVVLQEEHFGRKQQHDITGYNILPRGYCTYRNRSDGVDFTFNINKCCDKGIISKFYPVFYGNNSDVFFISLVLNHSEEVVHEIGYTCTGTGQKVLSFLDLLKMHITIPSYDEQKKIASYFEQLDSLITLHQRKLEKLKQFKSGLLDKMFI